MIGHNTIFNLKSYFRTGFLWAIISLLFYVDATSQVPDSLIIIKEKPEKLLRNVRIQDVTQGGFNIWHDDFSGNWAGIDIGFNSLAGEGLSGNYPGFLAHDIWRSNSLMVNIIQQSIGLQKNRNTIGLVTGLGMQFKSYRLDNNTTIGKSFSGKIEGVELYFDDNQKSKFSMTYITAPLLIEFQIPAGGYANRFHISGGLLAGYRLSSHTKIKYRADRTREKLKTPGDFSLNDFRYGLMLRMGYKRYKVFVNYDLQPMFTEKAEVPDIFPFTVGFTLLSF